MILRRRRGAATVDANAAPARAAAPERWGEVSFEDRMATVDFRVGERPHIVVDSDVCRSCTTRECVTACPANLFAPTADGGILFNYEQCFECGTCYQICNREGAITWTYPDGGHGVVFRHG
ncbi:MAG: 4Fe-4S dicluster domain-containing protein [Actinomycetes bacterium]|jgi:ferredoxin like protein|nr:MAG: ferredoxin [Actinomycetota bacterium]